MGVLAIALTSFAVTLALEPLVIRGLIHRAVLDLPGDRSNHSVPVPRGGGAAVILGMVVGVLLCRQSVAVALLAGILVATVTGAVEDVRGLQIRTRLVLTGAAALLLMGALLAYADISGTSLVVLTVALPWTLAVVNAVNFMDGINGISAVTAMVGGAAYAFFGSAINSPALMLLGGVTAAAAAGFVPYNAPRARVFLGDVGSYGIGATFAAMSLLAMVDGLPVETAVAPLLIYLADTGVTILRRVRAREPLSQAHKLHIYQRLVASGWSHMSVSAVVAVLTLGCVGLGAVSLSADVVTRVAVGLGLVAVLGVYLALPVVASRRRFAA